MELSLRARVRAGDPDAFGVLFDECGRAVYNLAFRMTGNWSAAEEVVSLTFLEAWRLRGTVRSVGGSLRPWLLGIAVNVTRNAARASRRHQAALRRLPPAPVIPDFADDLAGRIDDAARLTAVQSAIVRLRRGEQEVLAPCYGWARTTAPCTESRWAASCSSAPSWTGWASCQAVSEHSPGVRRGPAAP